ncbi:MAG: hypothetical protein Q7S92_07090 [Candidatus Diapherotrites archaeon]|nr:hypothetical protein [Candidatus Diapherotrites archaeon]
MANKETAVSDTGPILHLSSIDSISTFSVFSKVFVSEIVLFELKQNDFNFYFFKKYNFTKLFLNPDFRRKSKLFLLEYGLHLGESSTLALALQEKIELFLTDDLDARETAKRLGLTPVGSIGILVRAFREKIYSKQETVQKLLDLKQKANFFVTDSLIQKAILIVENFN